MRYFVTGYSFLVSDQYGKKAMGLRNCEFRDYTLVTLAHFKL